MRYAALVGIALAGLGWFLSPDVFASAWLAGFSVWVGWPLGSLALLLVHRLTGGRWGEALAPDLLGGVRALWLLLPLALPLLLTTRGLHPGGFYLALPFLAVRAVLYLVAWLGLGALVLRASARGAIPGGLAAAGLMVLAVTMTFASIDLTMSLQPDIDFSAYGLVAIAGAAALAVAVAVLAGANAIPPAALGTVGALLLGAALLWGYLDYVQFLITAESDLPTDAPWYARRLAGGWLWVAAAVSALHLVIPVLTLMSRRMRRSVPVLTALAALLIVGTVLRGWWVVLPATPRPLSWIDFACLLAFAGCSMALPSRRAVHHA